MTEDRNVSEFRGVGWHYILHNMYVDAKNEITGASQHDSEWPMPNLWSFYYTANDDAELILSENKSDPRAKTFKSEDDELNVKYGSRIEHRMEREERRERIRAAYRFYKRLRAFDLEEREQEWREDELIITKREESNAR